MLSAARRSRRQRRRQRAAHDFKRCERCIPSVTRVNIQHEITAARNHGDVCQRRRFPPLRYDGRVVSSKFRPPLGWRGLHTDRERDNAVASLRQRDGIVAHRCGSHAEPPTSSGPALNSDRYASRSSRRRNLRSRVQRGVQCSHNVYRAIPAVSISAPFPAGFATAPYSTLQPAQCPVLQSSTGNNGTGLTT